MDDEDTHEYLHTIWKSVKLTAALRRFDDNEEAHKYSETVKAIQVILLLVTLPIYKATKIVPPPSNGKIIQKYL